MLGLQALHSLPQPVSHRDIKPENVLLGDDGCYKCSDLVSSSRFSKLESRLCDFGSASSCNRVWGTAGVGARLP